MSVPSESGQTPSQCACTNISLMQLFHELKQKFPGVPDHVVSNTIELYCHDKLACEKHLHSEAKASLTHAYHASSSAAARQLNELRLNTPQKCPNQLITRHEVQTISVKPVLCEKPQTATISINEEYKPKLHTDANQNVLEDIVSESSAQNLVSSPVVNIDQCLSNSGPESQSDFELSNKNLTEENEVASPVKSIEQVGIGNYKIHKSNKVKCNLHEKLEKEKKATSKGAIIEQNTERVLPKHEPQTLNINNIHKEEEPQVTNVEKPKRPNTLDFVKKNPEFAFKETLQEPKQEPCTSISPTPAHKQVKETTPGGSNWPGYPLNLSVNVNCHMDYSRGYDPWYEDYESPRAITSVNLTVCTPTSNMASPIHERDDNGGFEGHVTVTVSPSSVRAPPRRRAPPPPQAVTTPMDPAKNIRSTVEASNDRALIERQKERLGRLRAALAQERGRVGQLTRETQILKGPPPSPTAVRRLKDYVHHLRDQCDTLAKRLEHTGNEPESSDFYSNIYTGQRPGSERRPAPPPPQPWQCHVCTFRNHPLLDKCEECDMPRILVGTSPATTLDSGFGSFRDNNRRPRIDTDLFSNDLPDMYRACV